MPGPKKPSKPVKPKPTTLHRHPAGNDPAGTQPMEWIGGRVQTSIGIEEEGRRFHAQLVLWAEVETGIILGTALAEPGDDLDRLRTLFEEACRKPAVGPPRVPGRIRVRSQDDAALVAQVLPPGTSLRIDPVPELDDILEDFERVVGGKGEEASYFDDGRSEPALRTLFVAADRLYRSAPWKRAHDCDLLRIDIPELGIEGLCLSILGADDIVYGFSLFESLEAYDQFIEVTSEASEDGRPVPREELDMPWRLLSFDRGADLPKKMRAEVRERGWPVAHAKAYPTFASNADDGSPRATTDRDLLVLACCADAVTAFAAAHPKAFAALHDDTLPAEGVRMEHRGEGLPACSVTLPYDPAEWAEGPNGPGTELSPETLKELRAVMRAHKARHYETWADHPLPALGGKTPREACRTKKGRTKVDGLLSDMEADELRLSPEERYDFSILRASLGL